VKLVHKVPQQLELVGWYSLVPKTGPSPLHLPIHKQIIVQNESAILLGFHVEDVLHPVAGDPLPLTIYESNMETDDTSRDDAGAEDKEMKDSEGLTKMTLKFRELPYTTETGEAEMIAMQFIREGAANASLDDAERRILEQFDKKIAVDDGKGKRRAVTQAETGKGKAVDDATSKAHSKDKDASLTKSEAEYMSALQTKYNAIRMMKSRVDLIVAYLQKLPPDFASGNLTTPEAAEAARASNGACSVPSNRILRQIQALVTNIELATPAHQATLEREILKETNDVNLISLLADLVASVSDVREAGKKFAVVEAAKNSKNRSFDPLERGGSEHHML
jgi:COP9 signalosome complex subunit 6